MRQHHPQDPLMPFLSPTRSSSNSHPLAQLLSTFSSRHSLTFATLHQHCATLEQTIAHIEQQLEALATKVAYQQEKQDSQVLGTLQLKQNQLMISQLRNSNGKLKEEHESVIAQLTSEQNFNQQLRQDNLIQQIQINKLESKLSQKEQELVKLQQEIEKRQRDTPRQNRPELPETTRKPSAEQYSELETQLEDLEREFTNEVERLAEKNRELTEQIVSLQQQQSQQISLSRKQQGTVEELSKLKYEAEVKLRQETALNQELETSYNTLVQESNANEIALHKQLQEHKNKESQLRQQLKIEKKQLRSCLSSIACLLHGSKYYLTATGIPEILEEVARLHEKSTRKRTEQLERELQYVRGQFQLLRTRWQQLEEGEKRGSVKSVSQVRSENELQMDRVSEQGSSINRSAHRSEDERTLAQDKYKQKLEVLRKEIRGKQNKIDQLERQQQTEFQQHKQKILQCQQLILEKGNQVRRWELRLKEKDYQLMEASARLKEAEGKLQFQAERMTSQKEANAKIIEMRTGSYEQKLRQMRQNYKQMEKREQEKTLKYNKLKSKYEKYDAEVNEALKRKSSQIQQLLKDNNRLNTEVKLLQEKISIGQIIETELGRRSSSLTPTPVNQDLLEQMEMERDRIVGQLEEKQKQGEQQTVLNQTLSLQVMALKKELKESKASIDELERMERILKEEVKQAREVISQLQQENSQAAQQQYTYLKKQLQKSVGNVKKLERACEKYTHEREGMRKEIEERQKELSYAKWQSETLKGKLERGNMELAEFRERHTRQVAEYERRISQASTKEEQLVNIINYKNRESQGLRNSMKGQELLLEEQKLLQQCHVETMTEPIQQCDSQVNTDPMQSTAAPRRASLQPIIPSELLLDESAKFDSPPGLQKPTTPPQEVERDVPVNLFSDLVGQDEAMDGHFQICDEDEEINIGQAALNLQLKELFNSVRKQIQKVLNGEELSISVLKELPKSVEDDFAELISYVKEKMIELRGENNLTFIMAEEGSEADEDDIDPDLHAFLSRPSQQAVKLRRIIEEKDSMITSLMTEKTEQENTITEQQELQEQAERLHMQQYNVLKREIVEQKQDIDKQTLYYESLKNVFKKMINFWIDDEDNYDDFRDNLMLFGSIYEFSKKERGLLQLYLQKYRQLKKID